MGAILQPYNTTAFTDNDFRPPFDARLRAAVDGEDEDGESDRRILNRSATQKWGDVRPERLRATRRWRASPARTGKPAAWRRAAVGALCARAVTARRRTAGRVVADRTLESQERR